MENKKEEKKYQFDLVDMEFIQKHIRYVNNKVEDYAGKYFELIRPSNNKKITIDALSKYQLMYIFYKLLEVVSNMKGDIPNDSSEIAGWIERSLDTSTSVYKIYMFLRGVTDNLKYNLMGSEIEEKTLMIIYEVIEDEDIMQHVVEMFLLFIKKFSEALANINVELNTKKTSFKLVNGLLRNMNNNNTNPDIFDEIFEFANYYKTIRSQ